MSVFSFPKEDRILSSWEYRRIVRRGRRVQTENFRVFLLANCAGRPRMGIVASRKVGNAVVRNRVKRILREYFRLNRDRFPADTDAVITVRPKVDDLTLAAVGEELEPVLDTPARARGGNG